jgi:parallel beta-helix repeat protein
MKMMQNNIVKKGVIVGIVLLFVLTCIIPAAISKNTLSKNYDVSFLNYSIKHYNNTGAPLPILPWLPHRPIWIHGNKDLTRWKGVRSGNGTKDDPYIISRWFITGIFYYKFGFGNGYGITIANTDKYIVIRDNFLKNWRSSNFPDGTAIYLYNTKNVTIENNWIRQCNRAIHFLDSNTGTIIRNNKINDINSYTIIGDGAVIENNTLFSCDIAIKCSNSVIQYNQVTNSGIGIGTTGPCIISHNDLIQNGVGIGCYWAPHSCTIINNNIYSNDKGIYLIDGSKPEIHYNNFGYKDGGVTYLGTFILNGTMNWWGAANGPSGSGPGDGVPVCDYLIYDPWLTEPNPDAGRYHPLIKPIITGQTHGKIGVEYEYTFNSTDENGEFWYEIYWGDNSPMETVYPSNPESSGVAKANHSWNKRGSYVIIARIRDILNNVSPWGGLSVTMSRTRTSYINLFFRFLEQFPLLQRLLHIKFHTSF